MDEILHTPREESSAIRPPLANSGTDGRRVPRPWRSAWSRSAAGWTPPLRAAAG